MKKKKKKSSIIEEIIKASRKGSRDAEIEQHGHPILTHRIFKSKKIYNRKNQKNKGTTNYDRFDNS